MKFSKPVRGDVISVLYSLAIWLAFFVAFAQPVQARQNIALMQRPTGQKSIAVVVPQGWHGLNYDGDSGVVLALASPKGEIEISFATSPSLSKDSRTPAQIADRFAATWNLPLYRWNTAPNLTVEDTFRAGKTTQRYVASVKTASEEFVVSARLIVPSNISQMRRIVQHLLSSAFIADNMSSKWLPGISNTASVTEIKKKTDPHYITVDGKCIRLPESWVPSDMTMPLMSANIATNLPNRLDIVYVGQDRHLVANLGIEWLSSVQSPQSVKSYVERWAMLAKNWDTKKQGSTDLKRLAPKSDFYRRHLAQSLNPEVSQIIPRGKKVEWLFIERERLVHGVVIIENDKQVGAAQKAFEAIRVQVAD